MATSRIGSQSSGLRDPGEQASLAPGGGTPRRPVEELGEEGRGGRGLGPLWLGGRGAAAAASFKPETLPLRAGEGRGRLAPPSTPGGGPSAALPPAGAWGRGGGACHSRGRFRPRVSQAAPWPRLAPALPK